MAKLWYGTNFVSSDEPCLNLAEVNLMSPHDGKWHRYQIIVVIRNDNLTEYREDLGLAKSFKAHQFRIIGGGVENNRIYIEETVGRMKEMADQMRDETPIDLRELVRLDKIKT